MKSAILLHRTWASWLATILGTHVLLLAGPAGALGATPPLPQAVAEALSKQQAETTSSINMLWVIIAAALVFFMQAGFLGVEVGGVRTKNVLITAMKNCGDWMVVSLLFFVAGFGVMFGPSVGGLFGFGNFASNVPADGAGGLGWTFALYQVAFAGTAATIVSGSMAERTKFVAYLLFAMAMGSFIYPVFGHWAWGNLFHTDAKPLLASMGYIDFAGSSVVHLTGAVASLVGVKLVGPRLGLYRSDGTRQRMDPSGLAWSCLGTFILWFGWWGFNGGSTLALNASVAEIIVNTNLAGAAGGVGAFLHARFFSKGNIVEKTLGGALGGLVAITANCHVVSPWAAIAIGLIAAVLHNLSYQFILVRLKLDDVIGAIPVHGVCGVWGVLAVALFGKAELLAKPFWQQLGVQAFGIVLCVTWVGSMSLAVFWLLKVTVGLRVSAMKEIQGLAAYEAADDEPASSASKTSAAA